MQLGEKDSEKRCTFSRLFDIVLAFFSVVASSQIYPHAFRGAKLEKSNNIFHLTLLFFIHLQKNFVFMFTYIKNIYICILKTIVSP
ncbi:hypothetical protein C7Y71_006315 [Pseudoprevotella muciniphila]|uniref:Uncharacterized protein n=1 Tax=Pseudoprevotella muciniphila TaxID=2133944 RepID=A0A5P8E6Q6_9BACT|nr:hypothetical protein C7Y71_006315 [Pseudoprevotella muciniphila]